VVTKSGGGARIVTGSGAAVGAADAVFDVGALPGPQRPDAAT
jgi:hypothetical protein